tara:strand:- start:728 stop:946 length:219 start_codon:yes stop_codon:yes gene_type:complete
LTENLVKVVVEEQFILNHALVMVVLVLSWFVIKLQQLRQVQKQLAVLLVSMVVKPFIPLRVLVILTTLLDQV